MASLTVMTLGSSFTPKLAAFNSLTPTLFPLPPPRSFACSSSLPTPCLKASFGGNRVLQSSRDFKCHVAVSPVVTQSNGGWETDGDGGWEEPEGGWQRTLRTDAQEVASLGKFAVYEYNQEKGTKYQFQSVADWTRKAAVGGLIVYHLSIVVKDGNKVLVKDVDVTFGPYTVSS